MDFLKFLFSFHGRIHRTDFWCLVLITITISALTIMAFSIPFVKYILGPIFLLAAIGVWLSAVVRRLHDRDKSAWYLLIFYGVPTIVLNLEKTGNISLTSFSPFYAGTSILGLISGAVAVWMFVEVGCLRGTMGPNRYGPDPLEPEPSVA